MEETTVPATEEKAIQEVMAMEMVLGDLYLTHQSRARYFTQFVKLDTMHNEVVIKAYYPSHAEWRQVKVPDNYMMKVLTKEEQRSAYEQISRTTADTRAKFAEVSNKPPKEPGKGRDRGVISGLGMLESWGKYFAQFAHTPGMREAVRMKMKEEFPNKHDSVDKWLDAYRGYYNKGKLPGVEKPAQEITKEEWK